MEPKSFLEKFSIDPNYFLFKAKSKGLDNSPAKKALRIDIAVAAGFCYKHWAYRVSNTRLLISAWLTSIEISRFRSR